MNRATARAGSHPALRVLFVIDSLVPGGAERSLTAMAPRYQDHGVSLIICYLSSGPGLQDELSSAGIPLVCLDGRGGRAGNAYRVARLVKKCAPQLIHTALLEGDLAGRIASLATGIPVVSTLPATMYDQEHLQDPTLRRWKVRMAQLADVITAQRVRRFHAVSEHVAQIMPARLHVPRQRIEVIHRGRDPEILGIRSPERYREVRARLGLGLRDPILVAVGRQEHKKGFDVLLRTWPAVLQAFANATLLVAGREGAQSQMLAGLVSGLGLEDSVRFLGARSDVADLLSAADLFVLPSVSEGFPGILIEALALEVPVVSSDLPAIREILGGSELARLVPPRDPEALAQAILATLRAPTAAARTARRARQRFTDHFTTEAVATQMVSFYRRALGPNPAAPGAASDRNPSANVRSPDA